MWQPQMQALAERGFSAVAVDLPGFGSSPLRDEQDLDGFAARVLEVLDGLQVERAAFVGLSMGGYVLFRLWQQAPHRIGALVLADTRAEADSPEARERRYAQASQVAVLGVEAILEGFVAGALGRATLDGRPGVVETVRRLVREARPAGVVNALRAMAVRPDSTPLLPRITVPTLVVVGEQDGLTPPDVARRMAAAVPGATLSVVPEAGHLSSLEAPGTFNRQLLDFLETSGFWRA
ncbi:MAG: alpha/beta fold hydrolase [Limnochordaceae bacterium]|nr:alpha/beta fold hydrolase [Limnochordaceae bacterium]